MTKRGETASGDRHLVERRSGKILVAVIDGLGHGEPAARASEEALRVLGDHADDAVALLMNRCDERLRGTRGAAMSLASIDEVAHTMSWAGVGNVEGVLIRAGAEKARVREYLISRPGVVGSGFPALHLRVLPIAKGDVLVFATDGVAEAFAQHELGPGAPQGQAEELLARFKKVEDDALVVVVRFTGDDP